jgi:hypothetical protein
VLLRRRLRAGLVPPMADRFALATALTKEQIRW